MMQCRYFEKVCSIYLLEDSFVRPKPCWPSWTLDVSVITFLKFSRYYDIPKNILHKLLLQRREQTGNKTKTRPSLVFNKTDIKANVCM